MATHKWAKEKAALKKVQLHFDFRQGTLQAIRHDAADININTSDMVRKIVDLPYKKVQRIRLGLSFSTQDLSDLANRYGLDHTAEKAIKRRVMEEINLYYHKQGRH